MLLECQSHALLYRVTAGWRAGSICKFSSRRNLSFIKRKPIFTWVTWFSVVLKSFFLSSVKISDSYFSLVWEEFDSKTVNNSAVEYFSDSSHQHHCKTSGPKNEKKRSFEIFLLTLFRETKRNETRSYLSHIYARVHYGTMKLWVIPSLRALSSLDTMFRKIPILVDWQ